MSPCVGRRPAEIRVSPFTWVRKGPAGLGFHVDERCVARRASATSGWTADIGTSGDSTAAQAGNHVSALGWFLRTAPLFHRLHGGGPIEPGWHAPESRAWRARPVSPGDRYPSSEGRGHGPVEAAKCVTFDASFPSAPRAGRRAGRITTEGGSRWEWARFRSARGRVRSVTPHETGVASAMLCRARPLTLCSPPRTASRRAALWSRHDIRHAATARH